MSVKQVGFHLLRQSWHKRYCHCRVDWQHTKAPWISMTWQQHWWLCPTAGYCEYSGMADTGWPNRTPELWSLLPSRPAGERTTTNLRPFLTTYLAPQSAHTP